MQYEARHDYPPPCMHSQTPEAEKHASAWSAILPSIRDPLANSWPFSWAWSSGAIDFFQDPEGFRGDRRAGIRLPMTRLHPAPQSPAQTAGNGEDGETGTSPAETEPSGLDELLSRASGLAASYDYDGAIALLKDSTEFSTEQAVLDAIASYEEIKTTLVRADTASITHVFFHSLIMDT